MKSTKYSEHQKKRLVGRTSQLTVSVSLLTLIAMGCSGSQNSGPGAAGVAGGNSTGTADIVKIDAINDQYDPNHSVEVDVHPGDMITLSSDLLNQNNGYQPEGAPVEDFVWSASDSSSDVCDASQSADCLATSNFQVTNYGVSFYVPYSMGADLTITVTSNAPTVAQGTPGASDSIVFKNLDYSISAPAVTPTVIVTNPTEYIYNIPQPDPDLGLAGQGRWVVISNTRYWSPYTYVANNDNDWAPFRNGYWVADAQLGNTWVSYDPWGWMTDYYGVWRFHGIYGWVWLPFADLHYEPHTVSWFDETDDGYIGWYPYFPNQQYKYLYAQGYNEGFTDGYWLGFQAAHGYGQDGYQWHGGFTTLPYEHFRETNVENFYERNDDPTAVRVVGYCDQNNRFSQFPGNSDNAMDGRNYVQNHCGNLTVVQSEKMGPHGNIMNPRPVNQVPSIYVQISNTYVVDNRHPVGTVVSGADQGHPAMLPPSSNGRGIVNPPRVLDPTTNTPRPLPPQTNKPFEPNSGNPFANRQPPAPQPVKALPIYNPKNPVPSPMRPAPMPAPIRPAPVQPVQPPRPVAPRPAPVQPAPAPRPAPVQPAPAPRPAPVQPAPAPRPAPVQPAPAPRPEPVQPAPAPRPAPVQPAPAPRPAPVQPAPAPRPEPVRPAPAPSHRADPVPAPERPQPEPARPQPEPSRGERN